MKKILKYSVFLSIPILGIILFYYMWLPQSHTSPVRAPADTAPTAQISSPKEAEVVERFNYIEITNGCSPYYVGTCVNVRSGPGTEYPVVARLRTGVVLKVESTVKIDGHNWYRIQQDEDILYPERVTGDWYVYANVVELFTNEGDIFSSLDSEETTNKNIVVDLSEGTLYAYDGDKLFMKELVSTGLDLTPTAVGKFRVFKKTPSRYMQGPLPGTSGKEYDLPGVPWDLYFTEDGAVIHGAYWHDHFGRKWSHGCVNLSPQNAKKLYEWADIDTEVFVKN